MQYLLSANNNKISIQENITQYILFDSNINNITYTFDINDLNKNIEVDFNLINNASYDVKIEFNNLEFNNYYIDINNSNIIINKNEYSNQCINNQVCTCDIKIKLLSKCNNINLETVFRLEEDIPLDYSCPINNPFYMVNKGCVSECHSVYFFKKGCTINNKDPKTVDKMINTIQNEMPDESMDSLLTNVIEGNNQNLVVNTSNIIFEITTSDNIDINNNNNISIIYLGECGKRLKEIYNINNIIIFKIDFFEEGLLIPIVEYELYHPINKTKLDLNYCKDLNVDISSLVNIDEKKLFKYNSSDDYYNDLCFPYTTEKKTDIILKDRKDEFIKNNLSLCEKNCEYEGYNKNSKRSMCKCNTKPKVRSFSEITIDKDKLKNNFIDIETTTNLYVVKSYKLLLTEEGIKYNIGNYIIIGIIIIFIIFSCIFRYKLYQQFFDYIKIIIKYKYDNQKISYTKKDAQSNNSSIDKKMKKDCDLLNIKAIKNIDIFTINKAPKNNDLLRKSYNSSNKNVESTLKSYVKTYKNDLIDSFGNINEKSNEILAMNDYELNSLNYKEALQVDSRTYIQYYISLLKTKHLLIFTFYTSDDYNSKIIKICLFFIFFALYYTVTALFFVDSTMHKIYEDNGTFNFIYQLPKILYSTIISKLINTIVKSLSLTEKNIIEIIKEKGNPFTKLSKKINYLKLKFKLFFNFGFIFLALFWYYLSCFCAVYKNTQKHLIKNTLFSFALSLLYPLAFNLIPGIFRIPSLNENNRECLYKLSKILQIF